MLLIQNEFTSTLQYSLYNSAKLDPQNLIHFPQLKEDISNPETMGKDGEKAIVYLKDSRYQKKLIQGAADYYDKAQGIDILLTKVDKILKD